MCPRSQIVPSVSEKELGITPQGKTGKLNYRPVSSSSLHRNRCIKLSVAFTAEPVASIGVAFATFLVIRFQSDANWLTPWRVLSSSTPLCLSRYAAKDFFLTQQA